MDSPHPISTFFNSNTHVVSQDIYIEHEEFREANSKSQSRVTRWQSAFAEDAGSLNNTACMDHGTQVRYHIVLGLPALFSYQL